ncbi:efflux RND transporter periplasmic adaptor subunit [Pedobacter sp. SYSU D00535]|uniref:efflux RND transporter periplasmic adaptor subunit n=1 Tax=Pedobacter sp. SYSU D00535 TaxID=2810308 RepID=UPI001A963A75|nr:efflux RND transporter periplasmic adaptor subunit [Pedobacter sp. SYSU D00535]
MKLKHIIYAVLIIGFGSLIVYRISKNSGDDKGGKMAGGKPGGPNQPPMRVDGVVISPTRFENTLAVTGSIDPDEQVEIKGDATGLIRAIYFKEGTNVRKGQVLVKIDDSELRAQLAQAVTRQNLAAENERRARLLLEKEAISREEYDASLAELRSQRSQTQLVRAQIAKTVITAPFNGKVGLRQVSVGEYLTPTTAITTLVNINPVKVTFSVPEKYSSQVQVNTEIAFTVAGSTQKYTARVYAVEPRIEAATRTLQLRARADNSRGTLIPGAFANIVLPLTTIEEAILIPSESIVPVQNGKKVFVTEAGKAKEVMVETSTRTEKDVLVTAGLKPGDTVLTTGVMTLKEGAPVKVKIGL